MRPIILVIIFLWAVHLIASPPPFNPNLQINSDQVKFLKQHFEELRLLLAKYGIKKVSPLSFDATYTTVPVAPDNVCEKSGRKEMLVKLSFRDQDKLKRATQIVVCDGSQNGLETFFLDLVKEDNVNPIETKVEVNVSSQVITKERNLRDDDCNFNDSFMDRVCLDEGYVLYDVQPPVMRENSSGSSVGTNLAADPKRPECVLVPVVLKGDGYDEFGPIRNCRGSARLRYDITLSGTATTPPLD